MSLSVQGTRSPVLRGCLADIQQALRKARGHAGLSGAGLPEPGCQESGLKDMPCLCTAFVPILEGPVRGRWSHSGHRSCWPGPGLGGAPPVAQPPLLCVGSLVWCSSPTASLHSCFFRSHLAFLMALHPPRPSWWPLAAVGHSTPPPPSILLPAPAGPGPATSPAFGSLVSLGAGAEWPKERPRPGHLRPCRRPVL